jgi:hypothetical protein
VLIPQWFRRGDLDVDDTDWESFIHFTENGDWSDAICEQAEVIVDMFHKWRSNKKEMNHE